MAPEAKTTRQRRPRSVPEPSDGMPLRVQQATWALLNLAGPSTTYEVHAVDAGAIGIQSTNTSLSQARRYGLVDGRKGLWWALDQAHERIDAHGTAYHELVEIPPDGLPSWFWAKVNKDAPNGCWQWTGAVNRAKGHPLTVNDGYFGKGKRGCVPCKREQQNAAARRRQQARLQSVEQAAFPQCSRVTPEPGEPT